MHRAHPGSLSGLRLCILLSLLWRASPNAKARCVPRCRCLPNAQALNGTHCTCKPGFKAESGLRAFTFPYETCKDVTSSGTSQGKKELQQLVEEVGAQLNATIWAMGESREVAARASALLQRVERAALDISLKTPMQTVQKSLNCSVAAETRVVQRCPPGEQTFHLRAQMDAMDIRCSDVHHESSSGPSAVVFIAYDSLGDFINAAFFKAPRGQGQVDLGSRVVSAAVGPGRRPALSRPVILTLQRVKPAVSAPAICVYWDSSQDGGRWAADGCALLRENASHVTCSANHLSSFAVLMAVTPQEEDPVLVLVTRVGLSLSLLCLLLAALTFLLCDAIRGPRTSTHLHLCLCLFPAHLLFLAAIDRTEIKVLCSVIAGALHFLYLAAFTWMLLEGLQLLLSARHLTVANYARAGRPARHLLLPMGYGVPAVTVAVSAAARPDLYGTPDRCWLGQQQGFIWVFAGPAGAISCVNLLVFVSVLCILRKKLSSLNGEVSTIHNIRLLTLKAMAQLFILGCGWALGLLQVGPAARAMSYLFTLASCLQGVFLFLVHCVLNRQVQRWLWGMVTSKSENLSFMLSDRAGPVSRTSEDK